MSRTEIAWKWVPKNMKVMHEESNARWKIGETRYLLSGSRFALFKRSTNSRDEFKKEKKDPRPILCCTGFHASKVLSQTFFIEIT